MKIFWLYTLIVASLSAATIRVACGGPGSGDVWQSDISYLGGLVWSSDPGPTPPYYYLRYGLSFTYKFPIPSGNYNLTLKFIEPNKTATSQRIFKVLVNDVVALPAIDIFSQVGAHVPYDISIPVISVLGQLKIQFIGLVGNAIISGIQIDDLNFQLRSLESYAGFYRARFILSDGSKLSTIGVTMDPVTTNTWTEVK